MKLGRFAIVFLFSSALLAQGTPGAQQSPPEKPKPAVPGSAVRTLSRRRAADSVPSATTTMPAWIELPIPTPPP